MKKHIITTSIILALATSPVMASSNDNESDSTSEIIGFSTGAIIGGIIAGPIGSVAAGTIGVIIGQSFDRQEQVELSEKQLKHKQLALQNLSSEKARLESRLSESEQEQQMLIDKLALTENTLNQVEQLEQIKLNLRFEVDSSKVESFYQPQIKHLALMMQQNPELSVSLSGFADPSGNEESNMKLSEARTESVKRMLVSLGVNEAHISTQAFGESTAIQVSRTQSSDFNSRRVEVELIAQPAIVAKTQDNKLTTDDNLTVAIGNEADEIKTVVAPQATQALAASLINITDDQALGQNQKSHVLADNN